MFIGPKMSTVFTSRWKALAWSAGVLVTAYCSVPSQEDQDEGKNPAADAAVSAVTGLMGSGSGAQADSHVSPWALTTPTPKPTP